MLRATVPKHLSDALSFLGVLLFLTVFANLTISSAAADTSLATRLAALHALAASAGNLPKVADPALPTLLPTNGSPFSSSITPATPFGPQPPATPGVNPPAAPEYLYCYIPGVDGSGDLVKDDGSGAHGTAISSGGPGSPPGGGVARSREAETFASSKFSAQMQDGGMTDGHFYVVRNISSDSFFGTSSFDAMPFGNAVQCREGSCRHTSRKVSKAPLSCSQKSGEVSPTCRLRSSRVRLAEPSSSKRELVTQCNGNVCTLVEAPSAPAAPRPSPRPQFPSPPAVTPRPASPAVAPPQTLNQTTPFAPQIGPQGQLIPPLPVPMEGDYPPPAPGEPENLEETPPPPFAEEGRICVPVDGPGQSTQPGAPQPRAPQAGDQVP